MVESSSAVSQFVCCNSRRGVYFNIVEEAGRDNLVQAFTEQEVREYKYYLKFCVLKN